MTQTAPNAASTAATLARFGVDHATARQSHDGIVFQGPHGSTTYVEWKDLPAPKK